MVEIIIADAAWSDVEAIKNYIARESKHYAEEFVTSFFKRLSILHELPRAGRIVPEFEVESLRELILGSYRIIYRLQTENRIGVVRVIHSAQLLHINIPLE